MRPPYYYPPTYTMNAFQMPRAGYSPFAMRPPIPVAPPVPIEAPSAMPRLDSFFANANSLFNNAQKFTPYMQQAAPMFKNLPALWRMYKGFKQQPDSLESSVAPQTARRQRSGRSGRSEPPEQPQIATTPRPSVPRIYQPPYNF